ncbi:protein of unknown function [Tenacibaculum sp. 190130A14a]|uniref:Uncharacterized protein n=1 Tax=Tenacibaculum polynesiense TaxID=3137857 RepID=A0ABM9P894_9FLAO
MSKTTQNLVVGIGIASILFAIYGIIRGGELIDAVSGITIGVALIGTIIIEN